MSKIKVRIEGQFGRKDIYPVCEKAIIFARMLKRTCLTWENIKDIKSLGFEIETEQVEL